MDQHSVDDVTGRRPFGLFTSEGRWLAGNLRALPTPMPIPEQFFETQVNTSDEHTFYRSVLHRLPNGNLAVVSRNVEELVKFRHELIEATLAAFALMIVLGVAGGTAVGLLSLRRLDGVTRAIKRISHGNLKERLPSTGTDDDIDRLAQFVNSMLDQIERLMGEVKGVCDSIAHDLRTPLTHLLAALERANRRNLSHEQRRAEIDTAIGEVNSTLCTFAALLRISEIEDGARRASFHDINLRQLVDDAIEYYEPAADSKGITLRAAPVIGPETPTLNGDSDLLFEALGNLVDNAIKFTPPGGQIVLALLAGPAMVVSDTGCGVAVRDRDSVKLRFHRGSRVPETPGSGLGLPLVAAVARLHGMELRFEDAARGCRVVIGPPRSIPDNSAENSSGLNPGNESATERSQKLSYENVVINSV